MLSAFYATDLTDAEWHILSPFLPAAKPGGRPRTHNVRRIVNAILYVLRTGCHWRLLPHEYPNWKTVYDYFWKWRQQGLWQAINEILRGQVRRAVGRTALPSAAILDSQSAKTTECGGPRGYDGGKKLSGRKRHVLVDTQGFLLNAVVQEADLADRDGAYQVLDHMHTSFPRLKHVWMDMGYRSERLRQWMIAQHLEQEIVQQPRRWVRCPVDQEPPPMPAFTVLKHRWIVERTFAWLGRNRRLSKDYEHWPETSEAWLYLGMCRLLLRRLTNPSPSWRKIPTT
jgi:putative transposase